MLLKEKKKNAISNSDASSRNNIDGSGYTWDNNIGETHDNNGDGSSNNNITTAFSYKNGIVSDTITVHHTVVLMEVATLPLMP